MNEEKQLVLMVGIAGSGKSLFVDRHYRKTHQVLCLDDVRLALGSVYEPRHEPVVRAHTDIHARALMERGLSIVVDATCVQLYIVKKWRKLADEYGYKILGVQIEASYMICEPRVEGRMSTTVLMNQDNQLAEMLELKEKYFDEFEVWDQNHHMQENFKYKRSEDE